MFRLAFLAALALFAPALALAQVTISPPSNRVSDWMNQPYTGMFAMTVDSTYAPGRAVRLNCTVAGNVSLLLLDGSTETYVAATGYAVLPLAVTKVASSGTTATCTYAGLK